MKDSPIHHNVQGKVQDRGTSLIKIWQLRLRRSTDMCLDLCGLGQREGGATVIDIMMLSDNVLLEIFDAYRICDSDFCDYLVWQWGRLVHVCQRWRQIIFASPLRLHLHLHCTYETHIRKLLGCWPAFPISVDYARKGLSPDDEDHILAALEHSDRVGLLYLYIRAPELAKLSTVIQKPFPVLKVLCLSRKSWPESVLPSGFLGGSAPCLQELNLDDIIFLELPTLPCQLVTLLCSIFPRFS